jgi:hypothetical protein
LNLNQLILGTAVGATRIAEQTLELLERTDATRQPLRLLGVGVAESYAVASKKNTPDTFVSDLDN